MPIVRTYQCADCNHRLEVTLTARQWKRAPPECPVCARSAMQQEFKPVAINGSHAAKASAIAEDILANDYQVADMDDEGRRYGQTPKVRYKDQTANLPTANWSAAPAILQQGIAIGRQTRMEHGSGLDVLQHNIKTGVERDLIADSKRRAMKVW